MIREPLKVLQLPREAEDWLCQLWDATQFLDDCMDGDSVDLHKGFDAIYSLLVGMPSNAFFQTHAPMLLPVMSVAFMKWKASDDAERMGQHDARSFMWRASFYDVVMIVVVLCKGASEAQKLAADVMLIYGEKMEDYVKEFQHA
jgi:hypothetical protein